MFLVRAHNPKVVSSNLTSATSNYSAAIGSEHPATIRIDSRPPQNLDVASLKRSPMTIDDFLQADLNEAARAADAAREVNGAVVACWLR